MGPGASGGFGLGKLLSKGPAAPAPAADDDEGMTDGGLSIAAGDLMRSLEAKDQAGVEAALKAAVMACQDTDYSNEPSQPGS